MTFENFLSYLQQLLTMVDSENEYSIALAHSALKSTIDLASISGKADPITVRSMEIAEMEFYSLAKHRGDFIGVPGEYEMNARRRRNLGLTIRPSC